MRVFECYVALRLGLPDNKIRDCLLKDLTPFQSLDGAGGIERNQGILYTDEAILIESPTKL